MAKANIETTNGTKITIDGNEDEIAKIIKAINHQEPHIERTVPKDIKKSKMKTKSGLTDYVRELKEEGFFDKPKDLVQIKNELARKTLIYPITSIQPTLVRLIQNRELGRLKENLKWVYVKR
jgi:hypothetical protein